MASLLEKSMQAMREGRKLVIGEVGPLSKEEAKRRLRRPTVLYYEGGSGQGMKNARYEFDFSVNEWKREREIFPNSDETGQIPEEIAESFLETVWTVCNLPQTVYKTESKRYVPASDEERYIFQSDTKRLTWFRALIYNKVFEWIAETDTSEPYSLLTTAYSELISSLGI